MDVTVMFMKDILSRKRHFGEFETTALTEGCTALLTNKLPTKLKDPRSFTIPCSIGNQYVGKALCDLGASINLMTMSIFKKLGTGEARATNCDLVIGRSIICPPRREPLMLELKPPLAQLTYAYLRKDNTLHVVVSTKLTHEQEVQLLDVLRKFKKALGWTITYIKGINPTISMHRILLKICHGNSIEQQRRLSPIMKEVVKTEIIKWLDVVVIYPILDSSWVSPVQCVPKKGDIVEKFLKVFVDDFSVFGNDFESCLNNLDLVLQCCKETNLVLNWEKCHFIVREGIFLGHKELKKRLVVAPIVVALYWSLPFELMCDASDFAIGVVLGQQIEFDLEILDRKGIDNQVADQLSKLEARNEDGNVMLIKEYFPNEQLLATMALPWETKQILNKVVKPARKDWSLRLDEAFWAYRTTSKTPLEMLPFKLVYGKPCHLPVELEHKAFFAIKKLNMDWIVAEHKKLFELNEMEEFRAQAYENSNLYKERTKRWHGLFDMIKVYPHGVVDIKDTKTGAIF
ncbi:Transposon Ty3-G Gag-Pol polyprotein [Gossypium australe]|uniref:Transposon Ty3-G Gag-Pol polyprotein n=1 Tax=Gossypium australe TaxID=47621 RepID=A0A5B6VAQ0_9ROSI|nr:Transposon Ty3-G Gag-Pol polyprotein [Gossypium australe]